jgi:hypothetical protein
MQSIFQHRRLRSGAERDLYNYRTQAGLTAPGNHVVSEANSTEEGTGHQTEKHMIPGVQVSEASEHNGSEVYQTGWADGDPENPMNWSRARKWWVTTAVCLIAMAVSIPSSIDGPVAPQFNEHYHVGAIAGSMTTGMSDFELTLS